MIWLLLGIIAWCPWIPTGYSLSKLLVLSLMGFCVSRTRRSSMDIPLCFGWGVLIASTIHSIDPYLSVFGYQNDWAQGLIGWGVITSSLLVGSGLTEKPLGVLSKLGAALALMCIIQRLMGHPRAIGMCGDPVAMGMVLAALTPLDRRMAPVIFAGCIATGTRGAMIGSALGMVLTWRC